MRALKILLTVILILGVIFVIGGWLIPSEWRVSRSITIQATPEKIYPYLSNFKQWERWSPWNASKDATLNYTYTGPKQGRGAKQSWTSEKMGAGWMQLTQANPETGVTYDLFIDMHGSQSQLHGKIDLIRHANGQSTLVTWTDTGNVGPSFVKRWMSLMIKAMLSRDIGTGLAGLKSISEQ